MFSKVMLLAGAVLAAVIFMAITGAVEKGPSGLAAVIPEGEERILQTAAGPIHLGDEEIPEWSGLCGNSQDYDFNLELPVQNLTLTLQTYGLTINAPVYLNYRKVGILPRQTAGHGSATGPGDWSKDQVIVLPTDILRAGLNRITITTDLAPGPKFPGDLDDFQIRNLRISTR